MADTHDPEVAATVKAELAIPRMAESDEVTRLVLFIASEEVDLHWAIQYPLIEPMPGLLSRVASRDCQLISDGFCPSRLGNSTPVVVT